MGAGACRVLAALAIAAVPIAAAAQVIPPAEQPGRQRERFEQLPAPQARPAGPAVTLPSAVAPPGAEHIALVVAEIKIVGSTVYRPESPC